MRAIKRALDPKHLMNPGKVIRVDPSEKALGAARSSGPCRTLSLSPRPLKTRQNWYRAPVSATEKYARITRQKFRQAAHATVMAATTTTKIPVRVSGDKIRKAPGRIDVGFRYDCEWKTARAAAKPRRAGEDQRGDAGRGACAAHCRTNSHRGSTDFNVRSYPTVESIARGLHVLRTVSKFHIVTIGDIFAETKIPKPTIVRVLETLISEGYVARDNLCGGYRITSKANELGLAITAFRRSSKLARPIAVALTERTQWPVGIGTPDNDAIWLRFSTAALCKRATAVSLGWRLDLSTRRWAAPISHSARMPSASASSRPDSTPVSPRVRMRPKFANCCRKSERRVCGARRYPHRQRLKRRGTHFQPRHAAGGCEPVLFQGGRAASHAARGSGCLPAGDPGEDRGRHPA